MRSPPPRPAIANCWIGHGPSERWPVPASRARVPIGAALTRHLLSHSIQVFDVNRPDKTAQRQQGKTDAVDAQAAARAVISGRATAQAKRGDGPVQIARMYKLAKDSVIKARTQAINQLKAVVVSADPALREHLAPLTNPALIRACADMASGGDHLGRDDVLDATLITLQLLAERIQQLTAQVNELKRRLAVLVQSHAPQLVERTGVGPDSAITLLITAGDNPERLTDEASFVALCGASPVERSSGKQQRRRLNRGGDRQANRPSTASCKAACAGIRAPRPASNDGPARARPGVK